MAYTELTVWTRGIKVHRAAQASVWLAPGPSGRGSTAGAGLAIDF